MRRGAPPSVCTCVQNEAGRAEAQPLPRFTVEAVRVTDATDLVGAHRDDPAHFPDLFEPNYAPFLTWALGATGGDTASTLTFGPLPASDCPLHGVRYAETPNANIVPDSDGLFTLATGRSTPAAAYVALLDAARA